MEKGQNWTPIYMLVVLIIAAILIMTLIKPLFRRAAVTTTETGEEAIAVAESSLVFIGLLGTIVRIKLNI